MDVADPGLPAGRDGDARKGARLREVLEDLIAEAGAGALLPSERALAERYGLARMTVRKELDRLVAEGAAYRVHGRGTFAATPRIVQAEALTSFTEDVLARGLQPGARVLAHGVVVADDALAAALELAPGARVVRVHRVRTADGEPLALEWAHLPADDFPGLEGEPLADRSLLALLRDRYGVVVTAAHQHVSAVALSADEAALLGVEAGSPGFLFRRVTRREGGRVLESARSLYRGDRYEIQIRQEPREGPERAR